jgi:hypothetical protein
MVRSIERLRRLISRRKFAPAMILFVGGLVTTDSTRRVAGYAGVLPIPEASGDNGVIALRTETTADARRDSRADHERVLYSPGHEPRAADPSRSARIKTPCTEKTLVQARAAGLPNS